MLTSETQNNLSSSWSESIRNCINHKKFRAAISIYTRNRGIGCTVTLCSIPLVLKACASLPALKLGQALHCDVFKLGVGDDVMVGTSLVDLYGKCRDIVSSRQVFDEMPDRNVVTWNALIAGYMRTGDTRSALELFGGMSERTSVTWNEMIDGYAKNGDMVMARRVFDYVPDGLRNVVSWTVFLNGYVNIGDMRTARVVFEMMRERNFRTWSVMISGYFKKGDFVKAREIFDRMDVRNLVNWNVLISGYAQNGMCQEALDSFVKMREEGFVPDEITVASVLSACAQSGMLDFGREVHKIILKERIELNEFVMNGLVDMYAKCGDLSTASMIFEGMQVKCCACWNSMISGYAVHGHCRKAIEFYGRMDESGVKPDSVTLLSVLSACAYGGFVEEGLEAFSKIKSYGVTINTKHYGGLVDLLGRAGKLKEAFDLVNEMPMEPNDEILGALLGACRSHADVDMEIYLLDLVGKMNSVSGSHNGSRYILLANIFAASERWEMAEGIRAAFSQKGSKKEPGFSALML